MKIPLVCLAVSLTACASYPKPSDNLATAVEATRGAAAAGAANVPEAALHLKVAEEEVDLARELIEQGHNQRADYMTVRAYNDAALAVALARENAAKARAQQAALMVRENTSNQGGAPQ